MIRLGVQVNIKWTIPKGSSQANDFKTKKIFVGGIPTAVTKDELKNYFSKYGKVVEHEIIRDYTNKHSRGFGFIVFDSEKVIDNLLANGNMIDMAGTQVEIKKAEPKKASNLTSFPPFGSDSARPYIDGYGGFGESYSGFSSGNFSPASYRLLGGFGGRLSGYSGYASDEFGDSFRGGYGRAGGFTGYRGESSFGYSSHYSSYIGGLVNGYSGTGLGAYGRGTGGFTSYGGPSSSWGYDCLWCCLWWARGIVL